MKLAIYCRRGGALEVTTGMTAIVNGATTITTLVGNVFDMITSNPLLCVFAAAGLLSIGIGVFKRLKRAAK